MTNVLDRRVDLPPEASVAVVGVVCLLAGLSLESTVGIEGPLAGLGFGLALAGTVYAVTDGTRPLRFGLTFVALVAAQLCFFGGVVRWLGAIGVGIVVLGVAYSRR